MIFAQIASVENVTLDSNSSEQDGPDDLIFASPGSSWLFKRDFEELADLDLKGGI